jgi:hypothetical protein
VDYIWIILTILLVTLIVVFVIMWKQKGHSTDSDDSIGRTLRPEIRETRNNPMRDVSISIMKLPTKSVINDKSLFEITDNLVISRISAAIPAAAQTAANSVVRAAVNKTLSDPNLYLVKIPPNTVMAKATKKGVQYAVYRGAKKGLAEVDKPELSKISKSTSVAKGVAGIMNVGSLVVGQYYMAMISSKLETMTKSIEKINDFQNREFMSRVFSLITLVEEISQFSSEIIENEEQRNRKLSVLDNLRANASELLLQVNITIIDMTKKNLKPDYKDYQKTTNDLNIWILYQELLVSVLGEISKLTYLLGKGAISTEASYNLSKKMIDQSDLSRNLLREWHDKQVKALSIDLDKARISKAGFEAVVSAIPGFLDTKYKYKDINQDFVEWICAQAKPLSKYTNIVKQVYSEDVEIIIKDGKYYYLHESSDEE